MVPKAPNQVPRISIPSRPMLTTPERSENIPPSPAMRIGTDQARAMAHVPLEVRSSVGREANCWVEASRSTAPNP